MKITTIYDNYKTNLNLEIGWGFSCLIETDKKILFDAGEEDKKLFSNMEKLDINVKEIDTLVISHDHWDHTGGLKKLKELNPHIEILMPDAFSEPKEIAKDTYTTGLIQGHPSEQSLVLKTAKGLVIITGCAHPGIIKIIKTVKDSLKKEIYLVLGGFHMMNMNDNEILYIIKEFRNLGVKKAAPSHCTGDRAIELFKEEYKEDFIENSAGNMISILKYKEKNINNRGYHKLIGGIKMVNVKNIGEKYKCNICGNEVTVTKVGGGELVCCGQPMELIQ